MTKALSNFKGRLHDPLNKDLNRQHSILKKGSIQSIDTLVDYFDIDRIRISMKDGMSLTLINDGDADKGQNVDTYK